MAWAGGAADATVTGINNIVQHFAAKKAARKQWKHFGQQFQTMRADLQKAGINPLIAFGGGAHAGAVPPVQIGPKEGLGGSGARIAQSVMAAKAQTSALKLQEKQTGTEHWRGERERLMANSEAMRQTMLDFEKAIQPERWRQELLTAVAHREALQSSARTQNANAQLLELQRPGAENYSKYSEMMGEWEAILENARKWVPMAPSVTSPRY